MKGPDLNETIRELIRVSMTEGARLSLRQVADLCDVNYQRLWRFTSKTSPTEWLALEDAQAIYETLTGKPLIND